MLLIALEARSTVWRIASSKLCEDWHGSSRNFATDIIAAFLSKRLPREAAKFEGNSVTAQTTRFGLLPL